MVKIFRQKANPAQQKKGRDSASLRLFRGRTVAQQRVDRLHQDQEDQVDRQENTAPQPDPFQRPASELVTHRPQQNGNRKDNTQHHQQHDGCGDQHQEDP